MKICGGHPNIIIGNYTFKDLDLSKEFRHLFINNNSSIKTIKENESARKTLLAEGGQGETHQLHEIRDVASNLSSSLTKHIIGHGRSSDGHKLQETLQTCCSSLRVEKLDERSLGTLWLNNVVLSKDDVFSFEEGMSL